jgi:hypothetical protein
MKYLSGLISCARTSPFTQPADIPHAAKNVQHASKQAFSIYA